MANPMDCKGSEVVAGEDVTPEVTDSDFGVAPPPPQDATVRRSRLNTARG